MNKTNYSNQVHLHVIGSLRVYYILKISEYIYSSGGMQTDHSSSLLKYKNKMFLNRKSFKNKREVCLENK